MKINQEQKGDSAVNAWISPDGHFSYVEFRNKEESESAMCLSKVKIGGYQLRVSQAKAYAKILVDPSMMNEEFNKGLVLSARSNVLFKDIDINKGRFYSCFTVVRMLIWNWGFKLILGILEGDVVLLYQTSLRLL